jgi:UDP-glucose:(heptosyl)LPS alpha-1,3-glucosyltransferase
LNVILLPVKGWTNHARTVSLSAGLAARTGLMHYDAVVGFNKIPGLDLYFAADPCLAERARHKSAWYRMSGRCRTYLQMERAVFGVESNTRILSISEPQQALYMRHYGTPQDRFFPLPPGVDPDRALNDDRDFQRNRLRRELAIGEDALMVLMVGSDYRRKGVDRAIRAVASLPPLLLTRTVLVIAGRGRRAPFVRLARKSGLENRVRFLGERSDVPALLAAADLLLHPAYEENTGTVLIEALAAGLPVLVTEVCGYSRTIRDAAAGEIVSSPFDQTDLDRLLHSMLASPEREPWRRNARNYVAKTDIFALSETAADIIEQVATWLSCPNPG